MQHPVPSVFSRTMKIFMNTEKSEGDKILPCLTPLLTKTVGKESFPSNYHHELTVPVNQ